MDSSMNKKRGNIALEFIKKTGIYIAGASGEYIQEVMPVTGSTISGAKDTLQELHSKFSTNGSDMISRIKQLNVQNGFKAISTWFLQKEDEFGIDSNFDDNLEFDIDVDSTSEISKAQINDADRNADKIAKTVVETSHKVMDAQISATANVLTAIDKQTAVMSSGFDSVKKGLDNILEVLTKNTATLIEATVASNKGSGNGKNENNDLLNRGFRFADYKKMVAGNVKNSEVGMMSSILSMALSMGEYITPQDVMKMGLDFIVDKKAPKFKDNLKSIDKAIGDVIIGSLIRMGESSNPIAKILGIKADRDYSSSSRSSLELKSVPFDSITKEAVTQTIPGYLRKILVALGGSDEVYDYRSRTFRSKKAIKQDYRRMTADIGTMYNAGRNVRRSFTQDEFTNMAYDLTMNDMGKMLTSDARSKMDSFGKLENTETHVKDLFGKISLSKKEKASMDRFAKELTNAISGIGIHEFMNQVGSLNVNRNVRKKEYESQMREYGMDMPYDDGSKYDRDTILKEYNKSKFSSKNHKDTSTGVSYTNKVLYEIYRRLNEGVNVFNVGSADGDDKRTIPFEKFRNDHIKPPSGYQPKTIRTLSASSQRASRLHGIGELNVSDDGPNELKNQTNEDGTSEGLTKGQRFSRWGKKRGGAFAHSLFFGSADDVKDALGLIVKDVSEVAGDTIKKGISRVNDSFGNISGFLKHKFLGSEYSYKYDSGKVDGEGKPIMETGKEEKSADGGILGHIGSKVSRLFSTGFSGMKKYASEVSAMFDYGDKDEKEGGISTKRKKAMGAAVGALVGANIGILGGPIGLLVGGVAGSALSVSGLGGKLKSFLFGNSDDPDKPGFVKKIFTPLGKMFNNLFKSSGEFLKKHIFTPVSKVGKAIHDGILSDIKTGIINPMVRHSANFIKTGVGFILTPFKVLGKTVHQLLKAGTGLIVKPILNIGVSFKNVLFGSKNDDGTKNPGLVGTLFKNTFGAVFQQTARTFGNVFSTIGQKIMDPISDILFVAKEKFKKRSSDFLLGKRVKGPKGEFIYQGGLLAGPVNAIQAGTSFLKEKSKTIFNTFLNGLGNALKTVISSPFALIRMINPLAGDNLWTQEGRRNIKDRWNYSKNQSKNGGKGLFGGLDALSGFMSDVGTGGPSETYDSVTANSMAADDETGELTEKLNKHRERRETERAARKRLFNWGNITKRDTAETTKVEDNTSNIVKSSEENVKVSEKIAGSSEKIKEVLTKGYESAVELKSAIIGEIIPGHSFKTHDTGLHERLDTLINLFSRNISTDSIFDKGPDIIVDPENNESSINTSSKNPIRNISNKFKGVFTNHSSKEKKETDKSNIGSSMIGAASSIISASGDVDGSESREALGIIQEGSKDSPNKDNLFTRFKNLLSFNKKNKDEDKDKQKDESGFSKIINFASGILGGVGSMFSGIPGILSIIAPVLLGGALIKKMGLMDNLINWLRDNATPFITETLIPGITNFITDDVIPVLKDVAPVIIESVREIGGAVWQHSPPWLKTAIVGLAAAKGINALATAGDNISTVISGITKVGSWLKGAAPAISTGGAAAASAATSGAGLLAGAGSVIAAAAPIALPIIAAAGIGAAVYMATAPSKKELSEHNYISMNDGTKITKEDWLNGNVSTEILNSDEFKEKKIKANWGFSGLNEERTGNRKMWDGIQDIFRANNRNAYVDENLTYRVRDIGDGVDATLRDVLDTYQNSDVDNKKRIIEMMYKNKEPLLLGTSDSFALKALSEGIFINNKEFGTRLGGHTNEHEDYDSSIFGLIYDIWNKEQNGSPRTDFQLTDPMSNTDITKFFHTFAEMNQQQQDKYINELIEHAKSVNLDLTEHNIRHSIEGAYDTLEPWWSNSTEPKLDIFPNTGGPSISLKQLKKYGRGGPADLRDIDDVSLFNLDPGRVFKSPFVGGKFKVTSPYGARENPDGSGEEQWHPGIDMMPEGTSKTVVNVAPGTITNIERNVSGVDPSKPYGNFVEYELPTGHRILNAHLAPKSIPTSLKVGNKLNLSGGTTLGQMGNTGNSYGEHLHFQVEHPHQNEDGQKLRTMNPSSLLGISATDGNELLDENGYSTISTDSTQSASSGPMSWISELMSVGSRFLNSITGGLWGGSNTTSDESSISSHSYNGSSGSSSYAGSASYGTIDGPVKMISNKDLPKYATPGKTFEIIDLISGQSWKAATGKFSSSYHTDWTPLTPADTAIVMSLSTFGNWTARPAIAKLGADGTQMIAVGIHLKPHAKIVGGQPGSPLKNSNDGSYKEMGGHMCMHYGDSYSNAYKKNHPNSDGIPRESNTCNAKAFEALELGNSKYASQSSTASMSGNDNVSAMFNFLTSKGMSPEAASAIIGNIQAESYDEIRPAAYRIDSNDKPSGGIAQWNGTRFEQLQKTVPDWKTNLNGQLQFLWDDIHGKYGWDFGKRLVSNAPNKKVEPLHGGMPAYMGLTDIERAARLWDAAYEVSQDSWSNSSFKGGSKRSDRAYKVYDRFKNQASTGRASSLGSSFVSSTNLALQQGPVDGAGGPNISIKRQGYSNDKDKNILRQIQQTSKTRQSTYQSYKPHTGGTDPEFTSYQNSNKDLEPLLKEVLAELKAINHNTEDSSNLLESIDQKEFGVDSGLRSAIDSMGKKNKTSTTYPRMNHGNAKSIHSVIRP